MKEFGLFVIFAMIALLVALGDALSSFKLPPSTSPPMTPVAVTQLDVPTDEQPVADATPQPIAGGIAAGNITGIASLTPLPIPSPAPSTGFLGLVEEAFKWVSMRVPYLWSGCSIHGIDCSCFVLKIYATIGVSVPRTTVQQIAFDTPVSKANLQIGDTVFFNNTCTNCGDNPTHEGLYIGDGKMIDAGDPVQVNDVFSGYYAAHYAGAGRPPAMNAAVSGQL